MPEGSREVSTTRLALLELKDEQKLVQEGYELLDEKRIMLAGEIQRQLARLVTLRRETDALRDDAYARTEAALGRHGFDELSVYPPLLPAADQLTVRRTRLLGLELLAVNLKSAVPPPPTRETPVNPTPEARALAKAHHDWLAGMVELAACCVNLRRLIRDYVRTERRAKAIENVLMPEIATSLKFIDEQLEGMDQEEVARLRQRRKHVA